MYIKYSTIQMMNLCLTLLLLLFVCLWGLKGQFRESEDNVIRFLDISGIVLEKLVQYFHYKVEHSKSSGRLHEFSI